jgi:hypothetical protein
MYMRPLNHKWEHSKAIFQFLVAYIAYNVWLAECYVVVEQICSNGYFIDMKFEVALRLKKKPNVIQ